MSYQLVRRDEYGGTDIVGTFQNVPDLVVAAQKSITADNIDNALTFDDKMNDWVFHYCRILRRYDIVDWNEAVSMKSAAAIAGV